MRSAHQQVVGFDRVFDSHIAFFSEMNATSELPLVVIVGPTSSGKSALSVWLAEQLGGEVIACDSTQLHRGFDIGTAKPSAAERRGVPHHLLDVLDGKDESTAGVYRERALQALDGIRGRKKLPILTVGTGLYLRALLEGLAEVPQRSEELRERLWAGAAEHAPGHLHRILRRLDRESAGKIAPADEQKLIRAIEICLLAKKPLSEVHRRGRKPLQGWRPVKIGLMPAREDLYERIRTRTNSMLARGWMEEEACRRARKRLTSLATGSCGGCCAAICSWKRRAQRFNRRPDATPRDK
jgi:tRNA dimethylallyltransferase